LSLVKVATSLAERITGTQFARKLQPFLGHVEKTFANIEIRRKSR
jgi:hypothetical protein